MSLGAAAHTSTKNAGLSAEWCEAMDGQHRGTVAVAVVCLGLALALALALDEALVDEALKTDPHQ